MRIGCFALIEPFTPMRRQFETIRELGFDYAHLTDDHDSTEPNELVQGRAGNFYGTTVNGGQGGAGTVFRLTIVPEFQAVTLTNGSLSLTWSTEAGGKYQLQYNSDLSTSNWTNLGSPVTATGAMLNTTDFLTNGPQRFYRLVVLP